MICLFFFECSSGFQISFLCIGDNFSFLYNGVIGPVANSEAILEVSPGGSEMAYQLATSDKTVCFQYLRTDKLVYIGDPQKIGLNRQCIPAKPGNIRTAPLAMSTQ